MIILSWFWAKCIIVQFSTSKNIYDLLTERILLKGIKVTQILKHKRAFQWRINQWMIVKLAWLFLVFLRNWRRRNPTCFPVSRRGLSTEASWWSAACCWSSVLAGCSAPYSGFTDLLANIRTDLHHQLLPKDQILTPQWAWTVPPLLPSATHAVQSQRAGGSIATPKEEWS